MSRYLPVLLIGLILGALVVSAQVSTGTISGVVKDQSGSVIPWSDGHGQERGYGSCVISKLIESPGGWVIQLGLKVIF